MGTLKVRLLGKPQVQNDNLDLLVLPAKVQELFFYLLLHHRRYHDRDGLAERLWGEATPAHSKKYLRQTLWQLQTALEAQQLSEPCLLLEKNWVQVKLEPGVWLDVQALDRAFTAVCDIPGQQLNKELADLVRQAVALYQGELLMGWYQDWCIIERERFQSMVLALLEKLMDYCIPHRHYERGVAYGMRALRYDRARERTHRLLMRLYYLSGNRSAALRQFDLCAAALAEELNVKPARRTLALRDQICADQLIDLHPPEPPPVTALAGQSVPLTQIMAELKQLQLHLAALQQDVKTLIQRLNIS